MSVLHGYGATRPIALDTVIKPNNMVATLAPLIKLKASRSDLNP